MNTCTILVVDDNRQVLAVVQKILENSGFTVIAAGVPGAFDPAAFLTAAGDRKTLHEYRKLEKVFSQADPAGSVFCIHKGKIKLSVVSRQGKEAVIALLGPGDFFGERCLAGQPKRMAAATAMSDALVLRIEKQRMNRVLRDEPPFSEMFVSYLLARTIRVEEDVVDQLFNSSEKRLARILLLLANFGKEGKPEPVIGTISQKTLAEMAGTTRSRVSFFMNKFRKLGFIQYNGQLEVHSSLLSVVLHD